MFVCLRFCASLVLFLGISLVFGGVRVVFFVRVVDLCSRCVFRVFISLCFVCVPVVRCLCVLCFCSVVLLCCCVVVSLCRCVVVPLSCVFVFRV